ncbi:MAG TPA: DUF1801 domain-containing protein [Candidatus Acidoferrum sp.]|nr:DUF1801 domain-containing protein [Candidatus Acidoferrum sp.]
MKKGKKVIRRAKEESGGKAKTVDEYLARVPEPGRATLKRVRAMIKSAVPRDATEVISYGIPAFKHKVVLIWFAAFADHCSLFPTGAIIEQFIDELKGYQISKGTIQFPLNKPLPASLVKKMVKARLAYAAAKASR